MADASPPPDSLTELETWRAEHHGAMAHDVADVLALVGYAERPRIGGWTLRSALVRYAQVEPNAASAVLELIRRTDGALAPLARAAERASGAPIGDDEPAVHLLTVAAVLDRLADALAAWADDPALDRPDAVVSELGGIAQRGLAALGVARETRPPGRGGPGV